VEVMLRRIGESREPCRHGHYALNGRVVA
jgi:hypothetical protein